MRNNIYFKQMPHYIVNILILCITLICSPTDASAQKFKKHKIDKFTWYEVIYPNGNVGLAIDKKKNIIIDDTRGFTSVKHIGHEGYRTFEVVKNGQNGVVDISGKEVLACDYDIIFSRQEYNSNPSEPKIFYFLTRKSNQTPVLWSIHDASGIVHFSSSDYEYISPEFRTHNRISNDFSSNIISYIVKNHLDYYGVCNKEGNEIIVPNYNYKFISLLQDNHGRIFYEIEQDYPEKKGIADSFGNILITPKYDEIYFHKDICSFSVELDKKHGICNENGIEIIPPIMDNSISWNNHYSYYFTKINDKYVKIDVEFFANPAQRITLQGERRVLTNKHGKVFSIRAYDVLEWDENARKYIGSLNGYRTDIDQLGKEENPITKQIFDEAYNTSDNNVYDKMALYNMLIEIDANNAEGYKAAALNNIGVMYANSGDEETALSFYDKAAAMGNSQASDNASSIRKARKAAKHAERWQKFANALGEINNALSAFSSTSQYSNNYMGGDDFGQGSASGGNSSARQSAYNHMANRAARLYQSLTNKSGYTGSSKTRSVDVSTYNKLRRDMRNYRNSARRDGITIQKSQYEDLSVY